VIDIMVVDCLVSALKKEVVQGDEGLYRKVGF
jgi:hypothetical protein